MSRQHVRVVIAPDEFGGTLTAAEAATAVATGWRRSRPDDIVDLVPQSDGGPGFLDVLAAAGVGERLEVATTGPLGAAVAAAILVDGQTVYIESAQACGLHLIASPTPETVWAADTAGVGTLLAEAVDAGARRIVVGLGGSGTVDGGLGACRALGGLEQARTMLADIELVAASDVTNPLLGVDGAAAVFGPQKGADPDTVNRLEARLTAWAREMAEHGEPVAHRPGAGAAGGLGAFLLAMGAERRAGAEVVAAATDRAARIAAADLVLTGEGRYDAQTAFGKVIASVTADASAHGVPVIVIAGEVTDDPRIDGVVAVHDLSEAAGSRAAAIEGAADVLADVAARVARTWLPDARKSR